MFSIVQTRLLMKKKLTEFLRRIFNSAIFYTIVSFAAVFYFSLLGYIFFLARRRRGAMLPWDKRHVNLVPLKNKIEFFTTKSSIYYSSDQELYKDLFGNIILFIPFAFFLVLVFQVKMQRRIFLLALLTSFTVELIQFLLSIGVADIDDIILNLLGTIIGILLVKKVNSFLPVSQKLRD